ncbi:hypothetical protein SASPL_111507 [Salvia splendens]|uniref:Uncharacterized protein n=1 Tax=Salvia splendens TaxID=180675 RepID=A0A8X8YC19_SALSN|nr:hypothetical protein SASPL_111507 [Salvia splendens]
MIGIVKGGMKEEKIRQVADEAVQTTLVHHFVSLTSLCVNQQWRRGEAEFEGGDDVYIVDRAEEKGIELPYSARGPVRRKLPRRRPDEGGVGAHLRRLSHLRPPHPNPQRG